jgi:hypothetical protein
MLPCVLNKLRIIKMQKIRKTKERRLLGMKTTCSVQPSFIAHLDLNDYGEEDTV